MYIRALAVVHTHYSKLLKGKPILTCLSAEWLWIFRCSRNFKFDTYMWMSRQFKLHATTLGIYIYTKARPYLLIANKSSGRMENQTRRITWIWLISKIFASFSKSKHGSLVYILSSTTKKKYFFPSAYIRKCFPIDARQQSKRYWRLFSIQVRI